MFGYLVADLGSLSPAEQERYKACYCGLCRSLRRHGQAARLTLSYDLCFLVLLLGSLYEPEEESGEARCLRHPKSPRPWAGSPVIDYGADMDLILAYLKCLDDWRDDRSIPALLSALLFRRSYKRLLEKYPRQCAAIERAMEELHAIEDSRREDPDAAAACFGRLMGELLVYKEDRWSKELWAMGYSLGRFIYLMDACMDLKEDAARGRYNPLKSYLGLEDEEQRFRDILKMELGDCVYHFDKLPLVEDAGLLKNILCRGLWAAFERKYSTGRDAG